MKVCKGIQRCANRHVVVHKMDLDRAKRHALIGDGKQLHSGGALTRPARNTNYATISHEMGQVAPTIENTPRCHMSSVPDCKCAIRQEIPGICALMTAAAIVPPSAPPLRPGSAAAAHGRSARTAYPVPSRRGRPVPRRPANALAHR